MNDLETFIPPPVPGTSPEALKIKTLYELEKEHIISTLEKLERNKTQAAKALGITVKTLYTKLQEYGVFEQYRIRYPRRKRRKRRKR